MLASHASLPMLVMGPSSHPAAPVVGAPQRKRQFRCSSGAPKPTSKWPRRNPEHQRKRVKFADHVDYRRVERQVEEMDDDEEIYARWYQYGEYQEIKQDNRAAIREAVLRRSQGKSDTALGYCDMKHSDDEQHCTRGLEIVVRALLFRMPPADRQKKVVRAVLCMQQLLRQVENGRTDRDEPLRAASTAISGYDMLCALQRGAADASHNNPN